MDSTNTNPIYSHYSVPQKTPARQHPTQNYQQIIRRTPQVNVNSPAPIRFKAAVASTPQMSRVAKLQPGGYIGRVRRPQYQLHRFIQQIPQTDPNHPAPIRFKATVPAKTGPQKQTLKEMMRDMEKTALVVSESLIIKEKGSHFGLFEKMANKISNLEAKLNTVVLLDDDKKEYQQKIEEQRRELKYQVTEDLAEKEKKLKHTRIDSRESWDEILKTVENTYNKATAVALKGNFFSSTRFSKALQKYEKQIIDTCMKRAALLLGHEKNADNFRLRLKRDIDALGIPDRIKQTIKDKIDKKYRTS